MRLQRVVAGLSRPILPLLFLAPVAAVAQDSGHVRVPFSGGSAWSEMAPRNGFNAPLPAGPAHANYGLSRNAQAAAPQDRLRLKPVNSGGM
jgi:hypothetical protein